MTYKVFVISLKSAKDRHQQVISSLAREKVDWSFINAVDGSNINELTHESVDVAACMRFPGYVLKPNEVACFLSHRALWEKAVILNEPIVILEDDAILNKQFVGKLKEMLEKINVNNIDILRLGNGGFRSEKKKIHTEEEFSIFRYKEDPLCALAYLISPEAAMKLLQHSVKFSLPVDNYIWRSDIHNCLVLDVEPHIFYAEDNGLSTIGYRKKPKSGLFSKIKIEFFRAVHRFKQKRFEKVIFDKIIAGNFKKVKQRE